MVKEALARTWTFDFLEGLHLGRGRLQGNLEDVEHVRQSVVAEGLDDLKIFRMTHIPVFNFPFGFKFFDVGSENSHLLFEVIEEVELVELPQSQLVIIVIE